MCNQFHYHIKKILFHHNHFITYHLPFIIIDNFIHILSYNNYYNFIIIISIFKLVSVIIFCFSVYSFHTFIYVSIISPNGSSFSFYIICSVLFVASLTWHCGGSRSRARGAPCAILCMQWVAPCRLPNFWRWRRRRFRARSGWRLRDLSLRWVWSPEWGECRHPCDPRCSDMLRNRKKMEIQETSMLLNFAKSNLNSVRLSICHWNASARNQAHLIE